jgi:hypothetical protein
MTTKARGKFPGFQQCIAMLHKHTDPAAQEDAFAWLTLRVEEYLDDLIAEFNKEQNHAIGGLLLQIIGYSHDLRVVDLLSSQLYSPNSTFRHWAVTGLVGIGSPAAVRALKAARFLEFDSLTETLQFQAQVAGVLLFFDKPDWEEFKKRLER